MPRDKYLPSHNRGILVPKTPTTIGGHLRRRRLQLKLHQAQAAQKLNVSTVTISRWECDKVHPTWPHQSAVIAYLGYDPFTNPALGRPKGNETPVVAFLSSGAANALGQRIMTFRLAMRKNRQQFAKELGVDVKTLRDWETGRHKPSRKLAKQLKSSLDHEGSIPTFAPNDLPKIREFRRRLKSDPRLRRLHRRNASKPVPSDPKT